MNVQELKHKLKNNIKGVNCPIYLKHPWDLFKFRYINYFEFMLPGETYCIEEKNNKWEVYYTERGTKFDIKEFYTENEACEYFYKWIMQRNII